VLHEPYDHRSKRTFRFALEVTRSEARGPCGASTAYLLNEDDPPPVGLPHPEADGDCASLRPLVPTRHASVPLPQVSLSRDSIGHSFGSFGTELCWNRLCPKVSARVLSRTYNEVAGPGKAISLSLGPNGKRLR
jgi:hypothetical protein